MTSYGAATTTDEILDGMDLTGRRIVVTGASSGLGEEACRALASAGATVTMLARSPERNDEAAARIRASVPDAHLRFGTVDLGDFSSIRACADALLADHDAIDVLMNNAGVMACPEGRTVDGFETQFGTNHLGHFLLTSLLYEAITAGDEPRVVTLTSAGHTISDVDLDDYNFEDSDYDPWIAYGRAKSANALFALELANRNGDDVASYSVHPGGIITNLGRHLTDELIEEMNRRTSARVEPTEDGATAKGFEFKSLEAGAATQVWAAVGDIPESANGSYLADCQVGEEGANPNENGYFAHIADDATAGRLWDLSEDLVDQAFPTA